MEEDEEEEEEEEGEGPRAQSRCGGRLPPDHIKTRDLNTRTDDGGEGGGRGTKGSK